MTLAPQLRSSALKADSAAFKVPKCVLFVPELPRNAMGQVQENVLREMYAAAPGGVNDR